MFRPITALKAAVSVGVVGAIGLSVLAGPPASSAVASHNPFGHLDVLKSSGAAVTFSGWAADPDTAGTVRVVIRIDNVPTYSVLANQPRPDVAKYFPKYGAQRGFAGAFSVPAGKHTVCVTAGDLATGSDTVFACGIVYANTPTMAPIVSTAATSRPIGRMEASSFSAGKLTVTGWTLDKDTAASLQVDVIVNGQSYGSAMANLYRPDVQQAYPGYWKYHGYSFTVPAALAPGNYELCVVAVNNAAGGNTILPCKIFTVSPVGEPAVLQTAVATSAANAIQAQAIRSGAARAADFPVGYCAAARIAVATRALLQQAAGRTTKPPAVAGVPTFSAATPTGAVDEQAVMGPTPYLGTYPAAKTGGRTGAARSLQLFANDGLVPPGGVGDGVVGAAPILPANGRTVDPTLPGYRAGYSKLRAEVALDAALAHLGDPYVFAAGGPSTFDCSGLTQWAWAKAGVSLTHYTGSQAVQGVRVKANQLLPGDLVLFGSDLHHVGMYLGAGYMLDAPYTGAYVRVDKISSFGDFTLAVRP
jgi:hypothetical protein